MYVPKKLTNAPFDMVPTILIDKTDSGWDIAYKNYLQGKNPTESQEWKQGVYLSFTWEILDNEECGKLE